MSQGHPPAPFAGQVTNVYIDRPTTNGLGIAGFVVSLAGLVLTCGALSPIGLILSLFALLRRPRGFAVAGTLVGLAGTVLIAVVIGVFAAGIAGAGKLAQEAGKGIGTHARVAEAVSRIESHRAQNSAPPDDAAGQQLIVDLVDGYNNGLHYKRLSETEYEVRSAGPNGVYHDGDDVTNHNVAVRWDQNGDSTDFEDLFDD
jgi:hypothetical protein